MTTLSPLPGHHPLHIAKPGQPAILTDGVALNSPPNRWGGAVGQEIRQLLVEQTQHYGWLDGRDMSGVLWFYTLSDHPYTSPWGPGHPMVAWTTDHQVPQGTQQLYLSPAKGFTENPS